MSPDLNATPKKKKKTTTNPTQRLQHATKEQQKPLQQTVVVGLEVAVILLWMFDVVDGFCGGLFFGFGLFCLEGGGECTHMKCMHDLFPQITRTRA